MSRSLDTDVTTYASDALGRRTSTTTTGTTTSFAWDQVGRLTGLADTATGDVTFLHGDLVGSTRTATDESGAVVATWNYSTFGAVTSATGGAANNGAGVTQFLFAGEYQDDSGLYFLRARFYDPVTASFLSVDPALAQTGSPYAYASGNPLQPVDPLGLSALDNPIDRMVNWVKNMVNGLTSWGHEEVHSTDEATLGLRVLGAVYFWKEVDRAINGAMTPDKGDWGEGCNTWEELAGTREGHFDECRTDQC